MRFLFLLALLMGCEEKKLSKVEEQSLEMQLKLAQLENKKQRLVLVDLRIGSLLQCERGAKDFCSALERSLQIEKDYLVEETHSQ